MKTKHLKTLLMAERKLNSLCFSVNVGILELPVLLLLLDPKGEMTGKALGARLRIRERAALARIYRLRDRGFVERANGPKSVASWKLSKPATWKLTETGNAALASISEHAERALSPAPNPTEPALPS